MQLLGATQGRDGRFIRDGGRTVTLRHDEMKKNESEQLRDSGNNREQEDYKEMFDPRYYLSDTK